MCSSTMRLYSPYGLRGDGRNSDYYAIYVFCSLLHNKCYCPPSAKMVLQALQWAILCFSFLNFINVTLLLHICICIYIFIYSRCSGTEPYKILKSLHRQHSRVYPSLYQQYVLNCPLKGQCQKSFTSDFFINTFP